MKKQTNTPPKTTKQNQPGKAESADLKDMDPAKNPKGGGHYTQMAWAKTR